MSLPNIIFIITDQQRYDTIAGLGASFMQTPHLDRLVSEGVSFDQCHCTGAVCVPSRASLFSMEYPHTVRSYTNSSPWQQCWVEDFQKVGYHTINVGKMHTNPIDGAFGFDQRYIVENKDRALPYDHPHGGFLDEWDKFMLNCGVRKPSRETYRIEDPNWSTGLGAFEWPLEEKFHPDTFVGTMAQWAVETREADTPLFLQIGFPGPHPPYDPPRRFLDLYENTDIPVSLVTDEELAAQPPYHEAYRSNMMKGHPDAVKWHERPSEAQLLRLWKHYAANVTLIDEQVGQILSSLENNGYLEDAIVVFMSDHGDCLGDHGHTQKWTMYDAVTRVPAIVWAPGKLPEGKRTNALIQHMDLVPLLFELAGVDQPDHSGAQSALPVALGESDGRDAVFAELAGRGSNAYLNMVRTQDWKLVHYLDHSDFGELYNLNADPSEIHNLWTQPEYDPTKTELLKILREWHLRQSAIYNC